MLVYLVLYHHSKRRHIVRSGLVRIPRSTHATLPQWMSDTLGGRAWRRVHLLSAALHHNIKSVVGVSIHFFPASSVYNRVPSSFLLPSFSRSSSVCLHDSRSVRPSEDFGFSSRGLGNGRSSVHFSLSCIGVLLSLPSLLTNICPPTLFGRDFCTT